MASEMTEPPARGVRFDRPVPRNGYAWWYVDAISDDGRHALTLIAFIGSVFSPYYKWARRGGAAEPENHCALNVALYGRPGGWAMTERGSGALRRAARTLAIGASSLAWDGGTLTIHIDERMAPLPRRLRGTVRLHASTQTTHSVTLDAAGRHVWSPLAPIARVDVDLSAPALRWSGPGYLDSNAGAAPLEQDFVRWDWCCARLRDGAAVLYDVTPRDAAPHCFGLRIAADGAVAAFPPPPRQKLPRTPWQVTRGARADGPVSVRRTLEDSPFYARSEIAMRVLGEEVVAMHETLLLDRFRHPVVQGMLPFRMPRLAGRAMASAATPAPPSPPPDPA